MAMVLRKLIITHIVMALICLGCDKINVENDLYINDPNHPALQNKLKTKREVHQGNDARVDYYYNKNGYLTKEETYSVTKLNLTHIYERNQNGQKAKEYSYTSSSAPSSIKTFFLYEYENGRLIKDSYYRNGELNWHIDHIYENNKLAESLKYENRLLVSISRTEYDPSGKVIKVCTLDSEEKLLGSTRYEYRQDTTLLFGSNSDDVENGVAYQEIYNSQGQIKEEAYLYLAPTGRRVTNRYIYNNEYLLVESHHFDAGFGEAYGPLGIWEYEYF